MYRRSVFSFLLATALAACSGSPTGEAPSSLTQLPPSANPYTLFESLQVRPLAMSPSGKLLYAVNTPDNRLEIFRITGDGVKSIGSVAVGLEPVAVAARSENEVWVVNHLSDSVSIVSIDNCNGDSATGHVARTLLVGDEPRDIVFAGPNHDRAFITTAHRGQNTGDAYDLQTPGVGRADVWVFDANNLGAAAGGTRLTKLTFFADTPRALAASPDGKTVWAAAFFSGNMTTSVSQEAVQKAYAGKTPPYPTSLTLPNGVTIPEPPVGLIVKYKLASDGQYHWLDAYGTNFDAYVHISLPDLDVFAIDASQSTPVAVDPARGGAFAHVGTTLFNMAVNPKNGKVYVSNTDAHNDVRFEGHTPGFTSVAGHIVDSRITVLDPSTHGTTYTLLNPHIDYSNPAGSASEKALSAAFPQDLTVSSDGATLFTVAQGSGKLAIYNTADVEAGSVTPTLSNLVVLSAGGPAGVVLDEKNQRAYVLTRFDNGISVVDVKQRKESKHVQMFNPEPASVTNGRKYLYDANLTSAHGDSACASCHIGGDFDGLAWDLGNPGGIPLAIAPAGGDVFTIPVATITTLLPSFAPIFQAYMNLKGPMTTQSLRGLDNHGAMHWRGDRNGAVNQDGTPVIDPATNQPIVSAQPNAGIYDEVRAFNSFNVAFPGLVGDTAQLSSSDMLDFTTFILQVTYGPNPIRNLDNSLTDDQKFGAAFFTNLIPGTTKEFPSDRFHNCNGCHTLDRNGNAGATAHPGFFGTDGQLSFEFETQIFKVPHLRNLYQKVGMFGSSPDSLQPGTLILQTDPSTGQPVVFPATRGFGFQHDGSLGQLEHFFTGLVFLQSNEDVILSDGTNTGPNPGGIPFVNANDLKYGKVTPYGPATDPLGMEFRRKLVSYLMAFDSNLMPIVGQQITLSASTAATAGTRVDLLETRAALGDCDLVARASDDEGYLFVKGAWQSSHSGQAPLTDAALRALGSKAGAAVTFTCVPPGEGSRVALDRDGDGFADGDEKKAHTDPRNPNSHP